jgi:uncharacterized membrane protein YciS (DUF1049 family)
MKIELIIIVFLAGMFIGYILKDLLTTEQKVQINVRKQKIKGDNSSIDAVVDVEVENKKERKGLFNRLKDRKLRKNSQ